MKKDYYKISQLLTKPVVVKFNKKQLIISIYDSWTSGCVKVNRRRNVALELRIKHAYWWDRDDNLTFEEWLLKRYGSSYDSIIVCEDGGIEVLK